MNFDAAALAYVRYVLEEKELKPGALAQKAGISASTLTRALNDPKHKFKLSMTTLQKIADFSGINPAPFLEARDSAELTTGLHHRTDLYRDEENPWSRFARDTMVVGEIAAGKWREPSFVPVVDYGPLGLISTREDPKDCFAVIVSDDSADMYAGKGDILFCTRITSKVLDLMKTVNVAHGLGAGPVVVERRSKDAFKIELTARLIRRGPNDTWELVSASHADHFEKGSKKRPHIEKVILDHYTGTDELKIIGMVEYVIRGDTHDARNWVIFDMP